MIEIFVERSGAGSMNHCKLQNCEKLPFKPLGPSSVPESLGERIVVNFQLSHFLVLISCHPDELTLLEHVGPKGGVGKLHDVAGSHKMEPRLVFVH